jgi:hypothetical protein
VSRAARKASGIGATAGAGEAATVGQGCPSTRRRRDRLNARVSRTSLGRHQAWAPGTRVHGQTALRCDETRLDAPGLVVAQNGETGVHADRR